MNGQRYLVLALAFGCIIAVGMSATTLDSSLSTDPDDVIDIDYKYLPFGSDTGATLKEAGQPNSDGQERAQTTGQGGESQPVSEPSDESDGSEGSSGSDDTGQSAGSGSGSGPGFGAEKVQWLLDLLGRLLAVLLVLAALALAYRYRDRLLGLVVAVDAWFADRSHSRRESVSAPWPRSQPANDVHRAWLAMVQRTNLDRPRTRTPVECARAAVDAGMDSDTVETLTRLFEEVRYGDEPVTDERCEQAREGLRELDTHPRSTVRRPVSTESRAVSDGSGAGSTGSGPGWKR